MLPEPLRNRVSRSLSWTPGTSGTRNAVADSIGMPFFEEAVAAQAVPGEAGHPGSDQEGRIAVRRRAGHPGRLAGRIVRHLVLEEDVLAALAVPDHLVLLVMLDGQPVGRDVVAVHGQAVVSRVAGPPHARAVIRAPGPDVVQDDVGTVHHQAVGGRAGRGPADAE